MVALIVFLVGLSVIAGSCAAYWHIKYNVYRKYVIKHDNKRQDEVFEGKLICEAPGPYSTERYRLYLTKEGFFILTRWNKIYRKIDWWTKFLHPTDLKNKINLTKEAKLLYRRAGESYPEFLDLAETTISHPIIDELEQDSAANEVAGRLDTLTKTKRSTTSLGVRIIRKKYL